MNPSEMAQRTAHSRIDHVRENLARDARWLAETADRYATEIADGGGDSGGANRIAQHAVQLAILAASLGGLTEASAYLDAVVNDPSKETQP